MRFWVLEFVSSTLCFPLKGSVPLVNLYGFEPHLVQDEEDEDVENLNESYGTLKTTRSIQEVKGSKQRFLRHLLFFFSWF